MVIFLEDVINEIILKQVHNIITKIQWLLIL